MSERDIRDVADSVIEGCAAACGEFTTAELQAVADDPNYRDGWPGTLVHEYLNVWRDSRNSSHDSSLADCGSSAMFSREALDELSYDEETELRGLWLSRLMFGFIADACHGNETAVFTETRSYEDWLAARSPSRTERSEG